MNISKRILALVVACVLAVAWWHANGIPDLVSRTYGIGRNSPMADRFMGFVSIIGTIAFIFGLVILIGACLSYAFGPRTTSALAEKVKREAINFNIASRIGGLAMIFAGLFIWFLAYELPDYSVSFLYQSRVTEPLRTILGMTSVACMFAGAALGFAITAGGGVLAFVPHRAKR